MDFNEAKSLVKVGEKIYSNTKTPKEGFLGSIAFGTKLDDGVFYKLMREGIISFVMMVDGVGEFSKK